jgi:hypothetical protein
MPDEPESQESTAGDEAASSSQPPKPRLPLVDDEYPMLIDREEEG